MRVVYEFELQLQVNITHFNDPDFYEDATFEKYYPDMVALEKIKFHFEKSIEKCLYYYSIDANQYSYRFNGNTIFMILNGEEQFLIENGEDITYYIVEDLYERLSESDLEPHIKFPEKWIFKDYLTNKILLEEETYELDYFHQYCETRSINIIYKNHTFL